MVDWWAKDDQGEPVVAANHPMFCVFTTNADADGKELAQPYNYLERNYRGMPNGPRHRVLRVAFHGGEAGIRDLHGTLRHRQPLRRPAG